jgi:hypothetical protein
MSLEIPFLLECLKRQSGPVGDIKVPKKSVADLGYIDSKIQQVISSEPNDKVLEWVRWCEKTRILNFSLFKSLNFI